MRSPILVLDRVTRTSNTLTGDSCRNLWRTLRPVAKHPEFFGAQIAKQPARWVAIPVLGATHLRDRGISQDKKGAIIIGNALLTAKKHVHSVLERVSNYQPTHWLHAYHIVGVLAIFVEYCKCRCTSTAAWKMPPNFIGEYCEAKTCRNWWLSQEMLLTKTPGFWISHTGLSCFFGPTNGAFHEWFGCLQEWYIMVSPRGWRLPEIHGIPCGISICCVLWVRVFANCEHTKYWCVLRLMAFLRLPKTVPKSPFEACFKDILRNLQCFDLFTETSTNRKTLKEHQNNLTLNRTLNQP